MKRHTIFLLMSLLAMTGGCASLRTDRAATFSPVEVARSEHQWTGIAVARDGRIFVNYPRWSDDVPMSVGVLRPDGSVAPYPNTALNKWEPGKYPADLFVCVQSVVVDRDGYLWILDPANPRFKGVVTGGPKLMKVDPVINRVIKTYRYAAPVIEPASYLNDVRIDTLRRVAYITDSGAGAIIVTDLDSGNSRRVLARHPSTQSEGITLTIDGKPWLRPGGVVPQVHADGIAMDREGTWLYYHALTGNTLYRIETKWLRDSRATEEEVARAVETVTKTGPADGMEYGRDGEVYVTALEENAIKSVVHGKEPRMVVQSPDLAWPDSLAFGPDGSLYVTTSQIHRGPNPPQPYKIFKITERP